MKALSDILLEILLAAIILVFAAAVAYPKIETEKPETDPPFVCQRVPCFRPEHKILWVSQKYLTRRFR